MPHGLIIKRSLAAVLVVTAPILEAITFSSTTAITKNVQVPTRQQQEIEAAEIDPVELLRHYNDELFAAFQQRDELESNCIDQESDLKQQLEAAELQLTSLDSELAQSAADEASGISSRDRNMQILQYAQEGTNDSGVNSYNLVGIPGMPSDDSGNTRSDSSCDPAKVKLMSELITRKQNQFRDDIESQRQSIEALCGEEFFLLKEGSKKEEESKLPHKENLSYHIRRSKSPHKEVQLSHQDFNVKNAQVKNGLSTSMGTIQVQQNQHRRSHHQELKIETISKEVQKEAKTKEIPISPTPTNSNGALEWFSFPNVDGIPDFRVANIFLQKGSITRHTHRHTIKHSRVVHKDALHKHSKVMDKEQSLIEIGNAMENANCQAMLKDLDSAMAAQSNFLYSQHTALAKHQENCKNSKNRRRNEIAVREAFIGQGETLAVESQNIQKELKNQKEGLLTEIQHLSDALKQSKKNCEMAQQNNADSIQKLKDERNFAAEEEAKATGEYSDNGFVIKDCQLSKWSLDFGQGAIVVLKKNIEDFCSCDLSNDFNSGTPHGTPAVIGYNNNNNPPRREYTVIRKVLSMPTPKYGVQCPDPNLHPEMLKRTQQCQNHCEGDYINNQEERDEDHGTVCELSEWADWTHCSVPCGGGMQSKSRQKIHGSEEACSGELLTDSRECNIQSCRVKSDALVDATYPTTNEVSTSMLLVDSSTCPLTDWTEWSPCSQSCTVKTPDYRKVVFPISMSRRTIDLAKLGIIRQQKAGGIHISEDDKLLSIHTDDTLGHGNDNIMDISNHDTSSISFYPFSYQHELPNLCQLELEQLDKPANLKIRECNANVFCSSEKISCTDRKRNVLMVASLDDDNGSIDNQIALQKSIFLDLGKKILNGEKLEDTTINVLGTSFRKSNIGQSAGKSIMMPTKGYSTAREFEGALAKWKPKTKSYRTKPVQLESNLRQVSFDILKHFGFGEKPNIDCNTDKELEEVLKKEGILKKPKDGTFIYPFDKDGEESVTKELDSLKIATTNSTVIAQNEKQAATRDSQMKENHQNVAILFMSDGIDDQDELIKLGQEMKEAGIRLMVIKQDFVIRGDPVNPKNSNMGNINQNTHSNSGGNGPYYSNNGVSLHIGEVDRGNQINSLNSNMKDDTVAICKAVTFPCAANAVEVRGYRKLDPHVVDQMVASLCNY